MGVRGLSVPLRTIFWLRDYLKEVGPINPYGFSNYLKEKARVEEDPDRVFQFMVASSYDNIRKLFWMLREVDAIEFDHEEPSRGGKPRRFYHMKNEAWFVTGLQIHFWPTTGLGAMRYRHYVRTRRKPPIKRPPRGEVAPKRPYERYWEKPERPPEELPKPYRRRRKPRVVPTPEITPAIAEAIQEVRRRRRRGRRKKAS